jgi:MFS-type transporter involved in bile tolerance (Atg22 family)
LDTFRGVLQASGACPYEAVWSLTEAANEPFFTLIQRCVFPPFFVGTLASAAGGFAAAMLDRRLGAQKTVVFGLSAVLAGLAEHLAVGPGHILRVETGVPLSRHFASPQEQLFLGAALLVAVGAGPALSGMLAGRSRPA